MSSDIHIPDDLWVEISTIIEDYGLEINVGKIRYRSPGGRREVTGLVVSGEV